VGALRWNNNNRSYCFGLTVNKLPPREGPPLLVFQEEEIANRTSGRCPVFEKQPTAATGRAVAPGAVALHTLRRRSDP
jgi:hypothetical protein